MSKEMVVGLRDRLAPSGILMPQPDDVLNYVGTFPELIPVLLDVCADARREFGAEATLSLELYRDPEFPDEYLTLYVRLRDYRPDIVKRLDAISERFAGKIDRSAGYLLVTTDFGSRRK
ncbi:MAG: hypothetical protein HYS13_18135 [Planctomycetia bacterium]|nr:hypothetical protein [Planctomycetia bacterium]